LTSHLHILTSLPTGPPESAISGDEAGADMDVSYNGWITIPILEDKLTPREKREEEELNHFELRTDRYGREFVQQTAQAGAEFLGPYRVLGRVHVYYTKEAFRKQMFDQENQRINLDLRALFMDGSNEPYTVTKAEFRTEDGQTMKLLYCEGKVEWEVEVAQRESEKEKQRRKRASKMNRQRGEGEPEVIDVTEDGGRIIEAEFEEKPPSNK
jgi:hypothetical protein